MTTSNTTQAVRRLRCTCCGESTYGRQHWNHDTGYGLCNDCIPGCSTPRNLGDYTMEQMYGRRGYHYDLPAEDIAEGERLTAEYLGAVLAEWLRPRSA